MLFTVLVYLTPVLVLYYIVSTYRRLSFISGPLLNSISNIPRLLSVYRRNAHNEQLALHKKYGDLVRIGPNIISVSGPDYVQQIYGIGKGLVKSDFYSVFQNIVNGKRAASLVAMTDESEHARTKRSIAHAYSLSTLVEFEPLVDSTTEVFLDYLDAQFASTGIPFDLGRWLQFYAFDMIGELTFSKRLGFIETGEDVENIIASIGANFDHFSVLGQMPWLDETFLGKNPLYIKFFSKPVASPILKFAQRLLQERLQEANDNDTNEKPDRPNKPDFLTRFLQIRKESEDTSTMSDRQLLSYLFMNINAGSDTIASTLRAIFYHLLKNPTCLTELQSELQTAVKNNNLTLPTPTWQETQSEHLTYLRAVIKEGLRINPALSLPLERVVPKEGLTLHHYHPSPSQSPSSKSTSTYIPPNTILGINPFVLHQHPEIFHPNPETFNPSRWLTSPKNQLKLMDQSLLSFGAGKRSCMGKNIAMLELHKIVPALLCRFEIELVEPEKEWTTRNSWVLGHEGWDVRIKKRK